MRRRPVRQPARSALSRNRAFTLIELIVVLLALGLLSFFLWIFLPSRVSRGPSRGMICAANLKGIGTSMKIYANDFGGSWGSWTVPPFDESAGAAFDYTVAIGGGAGTVISPDRRQESLAGSGGAQVLSPTRSFWMLVRSGDNTVKQFICPRSGSQPDETEEIDLYYDFESYDNISYGFQVPYGPLGSRPSERASRNMPLAADKGPYRDATVATPPLASPGASNTPLDVNDPAVWKPYNSPNHRGDGQNVLFADGHVSFMKVPIVGIDRDNIYTVAIDGSDPSCVTAGESPWVRHAPPLVRIDAATGEPACTDSVIFP